MQGIKINSSNLENISSDEIQVKYNVNYTRILRYYIDIYQKELDIHKQLSAPELYLLQYKVDELMAAWDKKVVEHRKKATNANGKDTADQMTAEALLKRDALSNILAHTLTVDDRINWEGLKDKSTYTEESYFSEKSLDPKELQEPQLALPPIKFLDIILRRKGSKLQKAQDQHLLAIKEWENKKAIFEKEFATCKMKFIAEQAERNAKIDALAHGVALGEIQSVIEHVTLVLEQSDYNDLFEKSFEIDYVPEERTLLIDYRLPSPDNMPVIKAVRFIAATGELKETYISEREQKSNYDMACYQICLRTIHEVLEADEHKNIENVLFNGSAAYINRATGQDTSACIMSILVKRKEFDLLELGRIDSKACFKSLKGIAASTLSALAPIRPVMELNKEDRRFIEARNTVDDLDEATNLAAMDWNDFEHLVRELFEKEFASRGGEVKITQASSDGGVDAIAFDPDPITGGKIVIQAKRYTRTVGVNAVRDLYGTMQHESASRGILITTADYGPDSHNFASGKPITLFTGANLLYLLEKHGYKAKIDLKEARQELNLRSL